GYQVGYRNGAGYVSEPLSAAILNANKSNDFSQLLDDSGSKVDFGDFWRTWNILNENFTPSSSTTAATSSEECKVAGAISGLVQSYGDPYTVFIPKANIGAFKQQVNGEFDGIGAGVGNTTDGATVVIGVIANSPAEKAGLKGGDRILAVNGQPTAGVDVTTITNAIRGPKGTVVTLSIARGSSNTATDVPITRDTIVVPTTATRVVQAAQSVVT